MKAEKRESLPIGAVMDGVLKKLGLDRRFKESQIADQWKVWVGEPIAKHCQPYRVINKKLIVYVYNSVWLTELTRHYKIWILKKIQTVLGKDIIQDIHFKIGEPPQDEVRQKGAPAKTK